MDDNGCISAVEFSIFVASGGGSGGGPQATATTSAGTPTAPAAVEEEEAVPSSPSVLRKGMRHPFKNDGFCI